MSTAKTESSTNEKSEDTLKQPGKKPLRAIRKGKWAGMTATAVAKLMGCSTWTAKQRLYKLQPMDLDDIGQLIHSYRSERESKALGGLLWGNRY